MNVMTRADSQTATEALAGDLETFNVSPGNMSSLEAGFDGHPPIEKGTLRRACPLISWLLTYFEMSTWAVPS